MEHNSYETWAAYKQQELATLTPLLRQLGYELEAEQPHLGGERYLMQAVTTTSGIKLILIGRRITDSKRVVIKATRDAAGRAELQHEHECRIVLHTIGFAYDVFHSPDELLFATQDGYTLSIQSFVEQSSTFLARPLEEQFSLALKAFKAQESAHAATYTHINLIKKTFQTRSATDYIHTFKTFDVDPRALELLKANTQTIEQYCGFLTHTDFVPHNIRVVGDEIYLLDHSSLRFGNKYEGWARFLNFMTLYNPLLEAALIQYVHDNRTVEESLSLKLMRVYRLGEIIWYYKNTLSKSSGDLLKLNKSRVLFWSEVLQAILADQSLKPAVREAYIHTRDNLRSEEEKKRQADLH